ncbi:MAG: hypothetical protein V1672_03475 [Candidatus Diapherotrites archaeon]
MENDNTSLSEAKKKRLLKIIKELKVKMNEIDSLAEGIESKEISFGSSPKKSRAMLEEIRVPALELLKDKNK